MAKKFAGFTAEQLGKIVPEMQGMQGDEQAKFLAANPAAAARVGKMAEKAQERIKMAYGGMVKKGYAAGGLEDAKNNFAKAQRAFKDAQAALAKDPGNTNLKIAVDKADVDVTAARAGLQGEQSAFATETGRSGTEMQALASGDPSQLVTTGTAEAADLQSGMLATGKGQAGQAGRAPQARAQQAATTQAAQQPTGQTSTTQAAGAAQDVSGVLSATQAQQGQVSQDAQVDAAQMDPTQAASLGLQAAQGQAAQVQGAPTRQLDQAELISGTTVDQGKVEDVFGTQPLEAASVADELDDLMQDFQGGATPAWAAGAMRAANAQMAARGLSASSMAGMAVVQAAMESALPIAQMDAANKQQVAVESARQRAGFLKMEFDQEFETKVRNAAKVSEVANMNFTAEQQVALENSKMTQTMNLANLSNEQAKIMADAATMSQLDMANLNNRQQAQVQNAKAFLQMDMTNLSNKQQMAMFKTQQLNNALLTDAAAENAARQFNASSENQTTQFFANLASQVERFNTEQANQVARFNAGEANAISQFNATQRAAREQFNANNGLIVAQANAQWAQQVTTAETAAQNQMNRDAAIQANKLTESAYNAAVQMERDTISYAFRAGESQQQRELEITLQGMRNEMTEAEIQARVDTARGEGMGRIGNTILDAVLDWVF